MPADLFDRYRRGDRRALSRLLTLAARGERLAEIDALLAGLPVPSTDAKARVFAFTGSAGVGKSSLIGGLVKAIRRAGETVAVLACDPQSPLSGGALLGDAFRIGATDDLGVFIRSLATPGGQGGLADHLDAMLRLLAGFGFQRLFIETVGSGQGDTTARFLADVVVLLLQPHAGDELQWEKAGVLEIADVVVVHKSDLPGAEQVAADLRSTLARPVPVLLASSSAGKGIDELWSALADLPRRPHVADLWPLVERELERRRDRAASSPEWRDLIARWRTSRITSAEAVAEALVLLHAEFE